MKLRIIIVYYNVYDNLKNCLYSILNNITNFEFSLSIIDNNSLNRNIDNIGTDFPDVNYYQLNSNLGFAKANNIGAKQSDSEFLCFLNPDTIVTEDFLTPIINYIKQDPHAGACAPMLLYEDNSYQTSSGFRMGFLFEFLEATSLIGLQRKLEKWKFNKLQKKFQPIKQGWLSGACMVMKRSVFEKVGGFTEDYFLNYEDIDLCKKIEDAGYNNYYFPAYKCIHLDHKSFDKNYELLVFSRYQSRLKYANMHYNSFVAFTVRIMHIAGLFLRIILVNFLYTKLERKSRLSGYFKALKLYFGMQN